MATVEDVVVGSQWKWKPEAQTRFSLRPSLIGVLFTIREVREAHASYCYYDGGALGARRRSEISEYAEPCPRPKCAPDCIPAAPCMTANACPGWREMEIEESSWARGQGVPPGTFGHWGPMERQRNGYGSVGIEPMRSGAGALACDWILRRL